jgi:hypothetical protein
MNHPHRLTDENVAQTQTRSGIENNVADNLARILLINNQMCWFSVSLAGTYGSNAHESNA